MSFQNAANITDRAEMPPIDGADIVTSKFSVDQNLPYRWAVDMFENRERVELQLMASEFDNPMAMQYYGTVVHMTGHVSGYITVIVEDHDDGVFKSITLVTNYYAPSVNFDHLSTSRKKVSVSYMGFFPEAWTGQSFLDQKKLRFEEILLGFNRVKIFVQKETEGSFNLQNTWLFEVKMRGNPALSGVCVDPEQIFGRDCSENDVVEWINSVTTKPVRKTPNKRKRADGEGSSKPAKPAKTPAEKKPRKSKKDSGDEEGRKVTADTVDVSRDSTLDMTEARGKEVKQKDLEEARLLMKEIEKYYTFGASAYFDIPVTQIHSAPATMCYRRLSAQHVQDILRCMKSIQGVDPMAADLVPYNIVTKQLVHFTNTAIDLAVFKQAVKDRSIDFVAISGQHSAEAAKQLIREAETDEKLAEAAEKLSFRKARILSSKTPVETLAIHSSRSNEVNVTMTYNSCFMDTIVHARKQYVMLNKPPIPRVGDADQPHPMWKV